VAAHGPGELHRELGGDHVAHGGHGAGTARVPGIEDVPVTSQQPVGRRPALRRKRRREGVGAIGGEAQHRPHRRAQRREGVGQAVVVAGDELHRHGERAPQRLRRPRGQLTQQRERRPVFSQDGRRGCRLRPAVGGHPAQDVQGAARQGRIRTASGQRGQSLAAPGAMLRRQVEPPLGTHQVQDVAEQHHPQLHGAAARRQRHPIGEDHPAQRLRRQVVLPGRAVGEMQVAQDHQHGCLLPAIVAGAAAGVSRENGRPRIGSQVHRSTNPQVHWFVFAVAASTRTCILSPKTHRLRGASALD